MRRFNDVKSYVKYVTEIIWAYIRNKDNYPAKALLAIHPELLETVIDTFDRVTGCEFYALDMFIKRDNRGQLVPNTVALSRMAGKYFPVGM